MNTNLTTNIACKITHLDISYREVVTEINGVFSLVNVNIIIGERIIRKIKFDAGKVPFIRGIGKSIAEKFLEDALLVGSSDSTEINQAKGDAKIKKQKVNKKAASKAALNLLQELGL